MCLDPKESLKKMKKALKHFKLLNLPFILCWLGISACTFSPYENAPLIDLKKIAPYLKQLETMTAKEGEAFQVSFYLSEKLKQDVKFNFEIQSMSRESRPLHQLFTKAQKPRFDKMSGELTVVKGSTVAVLELNSIKDGVFNKDELFDVKLMGPHNKILHQALILENAEPLPKVIVENAYAQKGEDLTLPIRLSTPSEYPTVVNIEFHDEDRNSAIPNWDFEVPKVVQYEIPAFATETKILIPTSRVLQSSGDKKALVHYILQNPEVAEFQDSVSESQLFILDSDIPQKVSVKDLFIQAGQKTAEVMLTLDYPAQHDIFLDFTTADSSALAGVDYLKTQLTDVKIAKGQSFTYVSVPLIEPVNPRIQEQSFNVLISNIRGATLNFDHYSALMTFALDQKSIKKSSIKPFVIPHLSAVTKKYMSKADLEFKLVFNHAITDLSLADLSLKNATASHLTGPVISIDKSQYIYTFKTKAHSHGPVEVYLTRNSVLDDKGHLNNLPSEQVSYIYDPLKPFVELSFHKNNLNDSLTSEKNSNLKVDVTFTKNITHFDKSDIRIENSEVLEILNSKGFSDLYSPDDHFVVILKNPSSEEFDLNHPFRMSILEDGVRDQAGNGNMPSAILQKFFKSEPPTIKISLNKISDRESLNPLEKVEVIYSLSKEAVFSKMNDRGFSAENIWVSKGKLEPQNPFCRGLTCKANFVLNQFPKKDGKDLSGKNSTDPYSIEFKTVGEFYDLAGNKGLMADPLKINLKNEFSTLIMRTNSNSLNKDSSAMITWTFPKTSHDFMISEVNALNGKLVPLDPFCEKSHLNKKIEALELMTCRAIFYPQENFKGLGEISLNRVAHNPLTLVPPLILNIDTTEPQVEKVKISSTRLRANEFAKVDFILNKNAGDYVGSFSPKNIQVQTLKKNAHGGKIVPRNPFCIENTCTADFRPASGFKGRVALFADNQYSDFFGNKALPSPDPIVIEIDSTYPGLDVNVDKTQLIKNESAHISWVFSKEIKNFELSRNLIVTHGELIPREPFCRIEKDSSVYICEADFKPTQEIQDIANIYFDKKQALLDEVGNSVPLHELVPVHINIDNLTPFIEVHANHKQLKAGDLLELKYKLSKDFNFLSSYIKLTGSKNDNVLGTLIPNIPFCKNLVCTAYFKPKKDYQGKIQISVPNKYFDFSGNEGEKVSSIEVDVDSKVPVVEFDTTLIATQLNLKNPTTPIVWNLSKETTQFSLKNIKVTHGTLIPVEPFCKTDTKDPKGLRMNCEALFKPDENTQSQTAEISFAKEELFIDSFNNKGLYGSNRSPQALNLQIDNVPPKVLSLTSNLKNLNAKETATIEVKLSEETNFSIAHLLVDSGKLTPRKPFCVLSHGKQICEATYSPPENTPAQKVTLSLAKNLDIIDQFKNSYLESLREKGEEPPHLELNFDTIRPTVTIHPASDKTNPGIRCMEADKCFMQSIPLNFEVHFSEDVVNLKPQDFIVDPNIANTPIISGSGKDYVVSISPKEPMLVPLALNPGSVFDAFKNPNFASNTATITFDNLAPELIKISSDPLDVINLKKPTVKIRLDFSERLLSSGPLKGLTSDLFTLSNSEAGTLSEPVCEDKSCSLIFTANKNFVGSTQIIISHKFKDSAGNSGVIQSGLASHLDLRNIDLKAPTVKISSTNGSNLSFGQNTDLTFEFDKIPVGFVPKSITVPYGKLAPKFKSVSPDKKTYTITYFPQSGANLEDFDISVKAGSFKDQNGNENLAAQLKISSTGLVFMSATCKGSTAEDKEKSDYHVCVWENSGKWPDGFHVDQLGNAGSQIQVTVVGGGAGGSGSECINSWLMGGDGGGGGGIAVHTNFILNHTGDYLIAVGAGGTGGRTVASTDLTPFNGKDSSFDESIIGFGAQGHEGGKASGGTHNYTGGNGGLGGGHHELNKCNIDKFGKKGSAGPDILNPHVKANPVGKLYSAGGGGGAGSGFFGDPVAARNFINSQCSRGGNGGAPGGGEGAEHFTSAYNPYGSEGSTAGSGGGGGMAYFNSKSADGSCQKFPFNGRAGRKGLVIISYKWK